MNAISATTPASERAAFSPADTDASCRVPVFVLLVGSAIWLFAFSVLGLLASIKLHGPAFLADNGWLTYGRLYAASKTALLYGFAVQAGLGVALTIIARLGRARVFQPWIIFVGGKLWNFGVLVAILGILGGDSTGFENFEIPRYAAIILLIAYMLVSLSTIHTLHSRRERKLEPSMWFFLAALFWFAWIFTTALLLLSVHPVRGITQAVIAWWYSGNLQFVWMALIGLGALFYFLTELMKRPLHSGYVALFTFWTIILFASWTGIPMSAPTPAWIPVLSSMATMMMILTVLSVWLNVYHTCRGCSQTENPAPGKFITFGFAAFILAWVMHIFDAIPPVSQFTNLTWYNVAVSHLNAYGFFAMTMFGAIYYLVPKVTGMTWPYPKFVRLHFWLAAAGVFLIVAPLAVAGVMQGIRLNNPSIAFMDLTKSTLHFLRIGTMGELLILAGHLLLVVNLTGILVNFYRGQVVRAYAEATAELKHAEVES